VAAAYVLDANLRPSVARNRKLTNVIAMQSRFNRDYRLFTGNSADRCRKLTFAEEKLRVSAVQSAISCLLSIASVAIHLPNYLWILDMKDIHFIGETILPPQRYRKESGQVPFLSGELVPVSGIWRPDHSRCTNTGDIWLRKQTFFPSCPGCGFAAGYALIEEILHISEDPDFQ
jgi:hypothetical protein